MVRKIIAGAAVAAAFSAQAQGLCLGAPIREANAGFASLESVVGTQPIRVDQATCGGGLNAEGERIKPWRCLRQRWDVGDGDIVIATYSKGGRAAGPWRLNGIAICVGSNPCKPLPTEWCREPETKPVSAAADESI